MPIAKRTQLPPPTEWPLEVATDNCDNAPEVSISYADVVTQGCTGSYSIARTWTVTATDHCDLTASTTCLQTITVPTTLTLYLPSLAPRHTLWTQTRTATPIPRPPRPEQPQLLLQTIVTVHPASTSITRMVKDTSTCDGSYSFHAHLDGHGHRCM